MKVRAGNIRPQQFLLEITKEKENSAEEGPQAENPIPRAFTKELGSRLIFRPFIG